MLVCGLLKAEFVFELAWPVFIQMLVECPRSSWVNSAQVRPRPHPIRTRVVAADFRQ